MAREQEGVKSIFDEAAEIVSPVDSAPNTSNAPAVATPDRARRWRGCFEPWSRPGAFW